MNSRICFNAFHAEACPACGEPVTIRDRSILRWGCFLVALTVTVVWYLFLAVAWVVSQ